MELDAIGAGLLGSLISFAIAWGIIKSRVEALWKLYDEIVVTHTRVDTMWECFVLPALEKGFVVKGLSLHLTDKGRSLLGPEISKEIDSLLTKPEILDSADPCVKVLNHLSDKLIELANQKNIEVGIAFGTAQAYIEEVLRAMPHRSVKKKSLFRRRR